MFLGTLGTRGTFSLFVPIVPKTYAQQKMGTKKGILRMTENDFTQLNPTFVKALRDFRDQSDTTLQDVSSVRKRLSEIKKNFGERLSDYEWYQKSKITDLCNERRQILENQYNFCLTLIGSLNNPKSDIYKFSSDYLDALWNSFSDKQKPID